MVDKEQTPKAVTEDIKSTSFRIPYLDNLKGFAIILVVTGHIIQHCLCRDSYEQDLLFRYIYGFHMQFFVFISALTWHGTYECLSDVYALIKKRLIQLIVPFLIWTLIESIAITSPKFIFDVLVAPKYGLWFLWDLFFISVSFAFSRLLSNRLHINQIFCELAMLLLLLGVGVLTHGMFDSLRIGRLFVFFILGYHSKQLSVKIIWPVLLIVIYFILTSFWNDVVSFSFLSSSFNDLATNICSSLPYRMTIAICGCYGFYLLGQKITNNKLLNYIGRRTLSIYVTHWTLFMIIGYYHLTPQLPYTWLSLFVSLIVVMSISLSFDYLISKNTISSLLLKGSYTHKGPGKNSCIESPQSDI